MDAVPVSWQPTGMSARPILVDVTRLLTRLRQPAPTGIDRVDIAYADRFLRGPGAEAVALTPFGARLLPPGDGIALVRTLAERWRDTRAGETGPATARLLAWLQGPPRPPATVAAAGRRARPLGPLLDRPLRAARALGWRSADAAARDAIYLHTSHLRLDRPPMFDWLGRRPDLRPVFFVHDLIPIEFPEYGVPGEAARHRIRMETIARHGAAAIANSADVAGRFTRHLAAGNLRSVPVSAAPLGVEAAFMGRPTPVPALRPYFVVCGTIEARKNHLLVLQIWRDLAAELGDDTPALVIVGRRGWESEAATDLLERCEAIRPHVIEVAGLPTIDLARLLAGARALLMPSFAEGYGIPVAEALSVGTRVIASDLPAHREVAGGRATLLHPLDGAGWRGTILAAREGPAIPDGYGPPSWDSHFAIVDGILGAL